MGCMNDLQNLLDLHAAATPGPLNAECIDQFGPDGKSWLIPFAVRGRYGQNALNFEEDEATAKFVAAAFTEVPKLGAALKRAEAVLASMESRIEQGAGLPAVYLAAAANLRRALVLEVGQ